MPETIAVNHEGEVVEPLAPWASPFVRRGLQLALPEPHTRALAAAVVCGDGQVDEHADAKRARNGVGSIIGPAYEQGEPSRIAQAR